MNTADLLEVLGWTGSAVLVWSLVQTRILRLRMINLVGCLLLIVYNLSLQVWPMVGLNVVLALINLYYLRGMLAARHDAAAYSILEVGAGDVYTRHFLAMHAEDIRRFTPEFDAASVAGAPGTTGTPADAPPRWVFLVLHGAETVGIVVLRSTAGGVAVVELDYVTPRYRDFTPGEFVFRRSTVLVEQGFRRVEVPIAEQSAYYERLGFRRVEHGYALDLAA